MSTYTSLSTPSCQPTPQSITINGDPYQLIAFYYPGSNTPWDDVYNAPCFGNFWIVNVTIKVNNETTTFQTAEAAFQATKWWDKKDNNGQPIRPQFAACKDGNDAFQLRTQLMNNGVSPDHTYAGLGRDGAMQTVLQAKFSDATLSQTLLATNDAYLLEHNAQTGRDKYWSDNHDGTGQNKLGILLMQLRQTLNGSGIPKPTQPVADFTNNVQS